MRQHFFVMLVQQGDRVGQVKLVVEIFRTQRFQARPQFFQCEAINAGIDFLDGALRFVSGFFFHHRRHRATRLADNPAVTGRIIELGGKNRGRGLPRAMQIQQPGQSLRTNQRSVAGKHHHILRARSNGPPRHLHGVAGAGLRLLQHGFRAQRNHRGAHVFCLVSYHHENFGRAQRLAGSHHVLHQRTPARAMQHLGKIGFQPRAFPRGKDYNNSVRRGHNKSIVALHSTFGNHAERLTFLRKTVNH